MLIFQAALYTGRALLYFGPIWWLVDRGGAANRILRVLAPIGQMSLTVYVGSTAVYLGVTALFFSEGDVSVFTQLGIGAGYAVVVAVLCPLWLRAFRFGPAEWLWRCLTYLRVLPMRRHAPPYQLD